MEARATTGPEPPNRISSVVATETSASTALITFRINSRSGSPTFSYRYRVRNSGSSYLTGTTAPITSGTSGTLELLGLTRGTEYEVNVGGRTAYFTTASAPDCDNSNASATVLGNLPTAQDARLTNQGELPVGGDCLSAGRAVQFFAFSLAEGGGVLMEASSDDSQDNYARPQVRLLRVLGETPLLENSQESGSRSSLAATLEAGDYVVEVRSVDRVGDPAATGISGPFTLVVRRLHPELISLAFTVDEFTVVYEAYTTAPNMQMQVQYRETSVATWENIRGQDYFTNNAIEEVPVRYVQVNQGGLGRNTGYQIRARFRYAGDDQWSGIAAGSTGDFVFLPAPPAPSLAEPVYNALGEPFSVLLVASWDYPEIRLTDGPEDSDWYFQVDWGSHIANVGQSFQSTNNLGESDIGRQLRIRVRAVVRCGPGADEAMAEFCKVFLRGAMSFGNPDDRYLVPEDETYYSAWSDTNLFVAQDISREITSRINPDSAAMPFVQEPIRAVTAAVGVKTERNTRTETWSFFLCYLIAVAGFIAGYGGTYAAGKGNTFMSAAVGALIFFLISAFAGPEWFGVPTSFAYGMIVVPLFFGALFIIQQVKT